MLRRINQELQVTILLITHEIHVIRDICHEVAVLEAGRIVERGPVFDIFTRPLHATTASFVESVTGVRLPPDLEAGLLPEPTAGSWAVLRLSFTGEGAQEPVIGRISAAIGGEMNILAGQVHAIGGAPFGHFIVSVPSEPATLARAQAELAARGAETEVLGYVA